MPPINAPEHQLNIRLPNRAIWRRQWRRQAAAPVFNGIPKEKDSSTFSLFCQSNLLNVKEKIFFGALAQRLSIFLERNNITDALMIDLANAFGLVPHKILWLVCQFHRPGHELLLGSTVLDFQIPQRCSYLQRRTMAWLKHSSAPWGGWTCPSLTSGTLWW